MNVLGINVKPSAFAGMTTVLLGLLLLSSDMPAQSQWAAIPPPTAQQGTTPRAFTVVKPLGAGSSPVKASTGTPVGAATQSLAGAKGTGLPLWFYNVPSSRDGNSYFGIMVGTNPYTSESGAKVPVFIVPVVLITNTIGVSVNLNDGTITTAPGVNTFDPIAKDNSCLAAPNNVPTTVFRQSPIFQNAKFNFGGTYVGNTQYLDAFQRANFWGVLNEPESYHVLLNPIVTLPPLVLNVPAANGTTIPSYLVGPTCGPEAIVDINWFDSYISNTYMPSMAAQGLNSGTLPIFQLYNVSMASPATNLFTCCILGYHGTNYYTPVQTYAVADFDTTGIFGPAAEDTAVLAHEIGEWVNDPMGFNPTPLWGNTGQVQGYCQNNLEVGDPLTGTLMPPVKMPNGFTYHLQELAFYSWFLGKPSIGANGWYSSNGTFLTDAGPPCQ